jgi:hypothetical protein
MKNFPVICIDNFYSDPDRVRKFALTQDYSKDPEGRWPGIRTNDLSLIDVDFFNLFCKKILSVYFDLDTVEISYTLRTMFQLINPYEKDILSPKNQGWIHYDNGSILSGVIYLNKTPYLNSGTSLHMLNDPSGLELGNTKENFYIHGKDINYNEVISRHNECFTETIRYNNVYNRMICFESSEAHCANNFFADNEPRLTQVFFIDDIDACLTTPISRQQKFL